MVAGRPALGGIRGAACRIKSRSWCCLRRPTIAPRRPLRPRRCPPAGAAMNTQSRDEFIANWDRQVGCPDQYDSRRARFRLVGNDRIRSRRRHLGHRRAPRAASDHLGMDHRGRRENSDPHADGLRRARQAGQPRPRARTLQRSRLAQESLRRSRLLLAQRHVGEEPPAAVPGVARVAHAGTVQGKAEGMLRLGY